MNSFLGWVGGKRLLRKEIAERIPGDIQGYIEPFGGAGWVLFYKEQYAPLEVYNDIDGRLVNLFRIVKYHVQELIRELKFMISSRELFYQYREEKGLTEIQRAARFLYMIKRSFGSKGVSYGISKRSGGAGFSSHRNIVRLLEEAHIRLDRVVIENLPYQEVLIKYDDDENFFYLDPPYFHGAQYEVGRINHQELLGYLKTLDARWLLSYDDCGQAWEMYKDYKIEKVSRAKGINSRAGSGTFDEVLIRNYQD